MTVNNKKFFNFHLMDARHYTKETSLESYDKDDLSVNKTNNSSQVSDKKINKLLGILAYLETNSLPEDQ